MAPTIGDEIREIHAAALAEKADPVAWVLDYLREKDSRVQRGRAMYMIHEHVTLHNAHRQAISEYAAETPLGHMLEEGGEVDG